VKSKVKIIAVFTMVCIILSLIISVSIMKFPWGTNIQIMSVEKNSTSRMKASYRYFDGTKAHKIYLKEGEILKINFKSEVKKGNLDINLLNDKGEIVKTLGSSIAGSEDIKAETAGEYTIRVKGYGTSGSYEVSWSK
jgi:hypothetical protein